MSKRKKQEKIRTYIIEYSLSANDKSQFIEYDAKSIDEAKSLFWATHRYYTIYNIKEKVENNSDTTQKLFRKECRMQKGLLKDAEHKAKKRLKHIKNKVWKLKHPDGKRKHRES